MDSNTNQQKIALITGAADRVGKAIALHLANAGYDIGIHYRTSEDQANQTKKEVEVLGRKAYLFKADLANPAEIEGMFQQLSQITAHLDVLINSAAIMPRSDLMKITWQDWDAILNTNLRAVWLVSRHAVAFMENKGVMINISDTGADLHWTGYGAYGISKYALNELTCLMAKQLGPSIRVCAIAPGLLMKPEDMKQQEWDKLAARVPMHSAGDLRSVMTTIDLLIANEYITGEIITLNGGASLG
jgi:pteridine reductase